MTNIYDGLRSIFFGDQSVFKEDLQNIEYTKIKTIRDTIAACISQPGVVASSLADTSLKVVGGIVQPGTAIDKYGRIIYVPSNTAASGSVSTDPHYHPAWPSTTVTGSGGYVNIYYDTQQDIIEVDDSGNQYYTRTYDSYRIIEEGSLPSAESGGINLLDVVTDTRPLLRLRESISVVTSSIKEIFNFMVNAGISGTAISPDHYWSTNTVVNKKAEIAFKYNGESAMNVRFCTSVNSTAPGILYVYIYDGEGNNTGNYSPPYSFSAGIGIYNFSFGLINLFPTKDYYVGIYLSRTGSLGIVQLDAIVIDIL